MKHIILIGFMGSGKSTLGKKLSGEFELPFVDMDEYIERKEGRTISTIFAEDGEAYFRSLETEVLEELLGSDEKKIVSLGGGTPLRAENRELMKQGGYSIFLKVDPEEAYNRLKGDTHRPLLQVENPRERICDLLGIRNPVYEGAADYVLSEQKKSVDEIMTELIKIVRSNPI